MAEGKAVSASVESSYLRENHQPLDQCAGHQIGWNVLTLNHCPRNNARNRIPRLSEKYIAHGTGREKPLHCHR